MSAVDVYTPSSRLRGAAVAEHRRVERELQRLAQRRDHLISEVAAVDAARLELSDQLRALNRFVHASEDEISLTVEDRGRHGALVVGGGLQAPAADGLAQPGGNDQVLVKGARIRETAVRVLGGSPSAHSPIHYRDWYALVFAAGFVVAGKNPYATFLTQVTRSPVVRRGSKPGVYALDWTAPRRLRQKVARAAHDMRALDQTTPTGGDALRRVRMLREELNGSIERAQRELEEALRSLGDVDIATEIVIQEDL